VAQAADVDTFSRFLLVPIVPSAVTSEEIAMREQQVMLAKEIELFENRKHDAGISTKYNVDIVVYFRLSSEIQLRQAKQILQLKQTVEAPKP
jgi:hypothetical protein